MSVGLALSFAGTAAVARAQSPAPASSPVACVAPSADALRAAVAGAVGRLPTHERTTVDFTTSGLSGRRVTVRAGADFTETTVLGPFHSARGYYLGERWHQNENGLTVEETADPGRATGDPTTTTIACAAAPRVGYVVSALDSAGYGTRSYVDAQTYRVYRQETIAATATTTTTYDDFRTAGGITVAWHRHRSDGIAANDDDERIVAVDPAPVAAADLTIPPSRQLVVFPGGASTVTLPVTFDKQKFVVRTSIGARGLDLTLDTGDAAGISIDEDVVRALGLRIYGERSSALNAGRATSGRAIVPELRIGSLTLRDVVISTIPHLAFESPGHFKSVGLLGYDFIASVALRLGYGDGTLTATAPDAFRAPADPDVITVPVRLGSGSPLADVTVNGALGERFVIDTGASGSLLLFDYFARRHPEALGGAVELSDAVMNGIGGRFNVKRYRLAHVGFASVGFRDFTAYRVLGNAYSSNIDGLLGATFLNYFTMYTDYRNAKLYFVPHV